MTRHTSLGAPMSKCVPISPMSIQHITKRLIVFNLDHYIILSFLIIIHKNLDQINENLIRPTSNYIRKHLQSKGLIRFEPVHLFRSREKDRCIYFLGLGRSTARPSAVRMRVAVRMPVAMAVIVTVRSS